MADKNKKAAPAAEETPEPEVDASQAKSVRVICEGYLGTQRLKKGDVTSDPEYVAILEQDGQQKVEAVK